MIPCVFCDSAAIIAAAEKERVNFLQIDDNHVGISLNETTTPATLEHLLSIFASQVQQQVPAIAIEATASALPSDQARKTSYLNHQTFQQYHSETALMRYIKSLERKDLALNHSMISLGSCTMKLNAAVEMLPKLATMGKYSPFCSPSPSGRLSRSTSRIGSATE